MTSASRPRWPTTPTSRSPPTSCTRHQQLPAELPGRVGHGRAAGGGGGYPAGAAGKSAARPFVPDALRSHPAGGPPEADHARQGRGGERDGTVLRGRARRSRLRRGERLAARRLRRFVLHHAGELQALFQQVDQLGPLERSLGYGAVSASVTVVGGFIAAWLLAQRRQKSSRVLDFLLLAAVALPSVVFAAGYIFAFNLPILSGLGINLYQTATLLVIAYPRRACRPTPGCWSARSPSSSRRCAMPRVPMARAR